MLTGTDTNIITAIIIMTMMTITSTRIRMAMSIPTIMSMARKVSSITARALPASMFPA